ncbi:MAG TPA: tetratricopeptide repeat protein [Phycisphaerae bacterium]|nr:tetratricopeptide repeat protein [Phycisphaerae bacterium]
MNVRVLLAACAVVAVTIGGGWWLHSVQVRASTARARASGMVAWSQGDWDEAARQLGMYLSREPNDVEALLRFAQAQSEIRPLRSERLSEAVASYERVLRLKPAHAEATRELADLYLAAGEPGEAERVARARLETAGEDPSARLLLARAQIEASQLESAARQLEAVVQLDPFQLQAYDLLGQLQAEQMGEAEAARRTFDALVERNPASPTAHVLRARFLRRFGDREQALTMLKKAAQLRPQDSSTLSLLGDELAELGQTADAKQYLRAAIEKSPRQPAPYLILARLSLREHQVGEALAVVDRAERELDGAVELLPLAVQCYVAVGNPDRAAECVARLRAAGASEKLVQFLSCLVTAARGQTWRAITQLDQVVRERPEAAEVWLELGRLFATTGQFRRSAEAYHHFVRLRPGSRDGRVALAESLLAAGEPDRAEQVASEAGLEEPLAALVWCRSRLARQSSAGAAASRADLERLAADAKRLGETFADRSGFVLVEAEALTALGQWKEAVDVLEQSRAAYPDPLPIVLALGDLHRRYQRFDAAKACFADVLAQHPACVEAHLGMARVRVEEQDIEAAIGALRESLQRAEAPSCAGLWLELARLLLEVGRFEESLAALEEGGAKLPQELRLRLAMLGHPSILDDPKRAQLIVDDVRRIEGEEGVNWKWQQARVWLAEPEPPVRTDAIVELLEDCVRADRGWVEPAVVLAKLRLEKGAVDEAIEIYENLLAQGPASVPVAESLLVLLESRGRYAHAASVLAGLPVDAPTLIRFRISQALREGERERAAEFLELSLGDKAVAAVNTCRLASLYLDMGRGGDADRVVSRAEQAGPDSVDVCRARVELELARGRPQVAVACCDDLARRMDSFEVRSLCAETCARVGQLNRAEDEYQRLTAFDGRAAEGYTLLGGFLQGLGRQKEAIGAYRMAMEQDAESSSDARRKLVGLLLASGGPDDRSEAKRLVEEALRQDPQDGGALALKAGVLAEEGPEGVERARQTLSNVVERDPHAVDGWRMLVQLSLQEGSATAAERILDRALAANPTSVALLVDKAELVAPEQPLLAVQAARQAVEFEPRNPMGRTALARAMIGAGQTDEALEMLGSCLDSVHGLEAAEAMGFYAEQLCQHDRVPEAQEMLREAERLAPWHPMVVRAQLLAAVTEGRLDQAQALAEQCLDQRGDDRSLLLEVASILLPQDSLALVETARRLLVRVAQGRPNVPGGWLGAAVAAHKLGRVDLAEAAFRKALDTSPDNAAAANGLAWVLCEDRGDPRSALPIANQGVKRWPRDVHLLDTRSVILFRLGRLEEAKKDLLRASDLAGGQSPTAAAIRFHLARVLAASGEREEARKRLDEALAMASRWGGLSVQEQAEAKVLSQQL